MPRTVVGEQGRSSPKSPVTIRYRFPNLKRKDTDATRTLHDEWSILETSDGKLCPGDLPRRVLRIPESQRYLSRFEEIHSAFSPGMSSNSGFANDSFGPGTTSTNTRSTSTIRARRLVSYTNDENGGRQLLSTGLSTTLSSEPSTIRSRGATPSPRPSRAVSPIPLSHPSRISQSSNPRVGNSLDFLDVSWTSLQNLASSVLGSDITRPATNGTSRTHVRKPSRPETYMRMPSRASVASSTWGPSGPTSPEIGNGTKEERQALLQAKKREALLLAETDPTWNLSSRHKRRDSSDQSGMITEHDVDALVYLHRVLPADSITGVTIRYGCQPAVFRKANGFWPSDSIQGRKTVLLPVDCCSVKGRPVQPPGNVNLLDDKPRDQSIEDPSGSSIVPRSNSTTPTSSDDQMSADTRTEAESDQIWKHESWVQIDGFPEPVEIGRVPRNALGFFPRTRRKSLCYTESESSLPGRERNSNVYAVSSHPAWSPSSGSTTIPQIQTGEDSSGSRTPATYKPVTRHKRQRSGLENSGTGVGTLDHSSMIPGPALDGLSKFFAARFPGLSPEQSTPNFDRLNEPTSATTSNSSTGLDNIGGAVEGWVRKMTSRAKASFNEFQQGTPNSNRDPASGRRGLGDLIELDDGLESTHSSGLNGPSWNPNFNRSGANLRNGSSLGERFPHSSPSTSRSRMRVDRAKDD